MDKTLPVNAGDHWSEKIPRASEELSLCTRTTEAANRNY